MKEGRREVIADTVAGEHYIDTTLFKYIPATAGIRMGVARANDDAFDSGCHDRIGTRWCASMM
jgi:hypothetical protein